MTDLDQILSSFKKRKALAYSMMQKEDVPDKCKSFWKGLFSALTTDIAVLERLIDEEEYDYLDHH